jgi:hypothetical protein
MVDMATDPPCFYSGFDRNIDQYMPFCQHFSTLLAKLFVTKNGSLAKNTSIILKVSTMTSHPIINGRDHSTPEPLAVNRFNVNVMFNIRLHVTILKAEGLRK